MLAEPLDVGLADRVQKDSLFQPEFKSILSDVLVNDFDWDELTADSVWAFGPARTGSNMLIDYTLSEETDKVRLNQVKPAIIQGF
jgi:hypothetical protein